MAFHPVENRSEHLELHEALGEAIDLLRAHPDELNALLEVLRSAGVLKQRSTSATIGGLVAVPGTEKQADENVVELAGVSHAKAGGAADLTVERADAKALANNIRIAAPTLARSKLGEVILSALVSGVVGLAFNELSCLVKACRDASPPAVQVNIEHLHISYQYLPPCAGSGLPEALLSSSAGTTLGALRVLAMPSQAEDLSRITGMTMEAVALALGELEAQGAVAQIVDGVYLPTRR